MKPQTLDVQSEMSKLYQEVRSQQTDLKTAAELANIAGKYLKSQQLQLAREIFEMGGVRPLKVDPQLSFTDAQQICS
jgi:hypothetical protein